MPTRVFTGLKRELGTSPGVTAAPLFPYKTSWGSTLELEAGAGMAPGWEHGHS